MDFHMEILRVCLRRGGAEALEAKQREEKAMFEPNFHSDKPRLVKLTEQEVNKLTDNQKKQALAMRYAFTRKRPTLEEAAEGKQGRLKVRIVCKDLKAKRNSTLHTFTNHLTGLSSKHRETYWDTTQQPQSTMHSEDICMVAKNGSTAESGHKFNPNKWNIEHAPQLTYPRNKM